MSAEADDPYVARLRAAGAIVLGKTNVAQMLLAVESSNPVYGRTNNPWNLDRSPGGSSGGEGAIVAAGGSPLGLGTDIGGSVRIPAAFCGIAALKPTQGRTPDQGRCSVPIGQRAIVSQVGVLARSVADVALGTGVIAGTPRGATSNPPVALGDHRAVDVAALRVAVYENDGAFAPGPAVRRGVREAAEMLTAAGARVTTWTPPDIDEAIDLFFGLLTADGGRGLGTLSRGQKIDPTIAPLMMFAKRSRRTLGIMRALSTRRASAAAATSCARSATATRTTTGSSSSGRWTTASASCARSTATRRAVRRGAVPAVRGAGVHARRGA